ncbi:agmatinase [Lentiprolixibacter aurantiacus]|uniref:Agmatinase n=1 Tax=Lentiprolixibacter aurantiacus TaxID=2993939 RepID=A0AAE3ML51_9FLAO|nr:agmatinase [Lentiprolixibacter aurantiacus]MCX2719198.1 agmatinase [Lentiprolixibacter aurantiacus]
MSNTRAFAGIPEEFSGPEKSKVVLIPVPYDGTSTWGKGADKGPEAFLQAAENMELYDIETDSEVYQEGIHLLPPLEVPRDPEKMVLQVHDVVKTQIKKKKFVTLIGGEHSISIGAIRAFNECFDNLSILQLDAHTDLRKTYNGSPFNHACALYEANENGHLIQVGIRSMDKSETGIMNEENTFFAHKMADDDYWMDNAIDLLKENVYITLDLDVFDPSIMPATGTPEPGGLLWYETLEFLRNVFSEKNVVGFDIVELCPDVHHKASDFLAAKLYYKMLSYKFEEHQQLETEEEIETTWEKHNALGLDPEDFDDYER